MPCGSQLSNQIASFLVAHLTIGNEASASCQRCDVVGTHLWLQYRLTSRHNTGAPFIFIVYDISYDFIADFDLTHPGPDDVKFCFNLPVGGNACISLGDLVRLITAIGVA